MWVIIGNAVFIVMFYSIIVAGIMQYVVFGRFSQIAWTEANNTVLECDIIPFVFMVFCVGGMVISILTVYELFRSDKTRQASGVTSDEGGPGISVRVKKSTITILVLNIGNIISILVSFYYNIMVPFFEGNLPSILIYDPVAEQKSEFLAYVPLPIFLSAFNPVVFLVSGCGIKAKICSVVEMLKSEWKRPSGTRPGHGQRRSKTSASSASNIGVLYKI